MFVICSNTVPPSCYNILRSRTQREKPSRVIAPLGSSYLSRTWAIAWVPPHKPRGTYHGAIVAYFFTFAELEAEPCPSERTSYGDETLDDRDECGSIGAAHW